MIKQTPTPARLAAMLAFALSCFGILMYLWLTFGGAVPLQPQSYRVHVLFPEATTLANEADVRISGVSVGKVKTKTVKPGLNRTDVVLEIDAPYAPIPANTHAILRAKTLLGETYVELTPGSKSSGKVPDDGTLRSANVAPTVELDEIFRTFDPKTRTAFQEWMMSQGRAFQGRGQDLNAALGNLAPFAENTSTLLQILDEDRTDVRRLIRNTGDVFSALTERQGQLRGLIVNSNRVFETTAARNQQLADTFRVLPTFLTESRKTLVRLTAFTDNANPLVTQLRPAARQLSPTLIELEQLAPDLLGLFRSIDPLVKVSKTGLPDCVSMTRTGCEGCMPEGSTTRPSSVLSPCARADAAPKRSARQIKLIRAGSRQFVITCRPLPVYNRSRKPRSSIAGREKNGTRKKSGRALTLGARARPSGPRRLPRSRP